VREARPNGLGVDQSRHGLEVSVALTYAISNYPELFGQMATTCVLIRNTLSFTIGFGITPWLQASDYLTGYFILAGIGFW
jgi:hypothetical protein